MQKHHSTDNDIMIFLEHLKFVLNGALPEVKVTTFYQNFVTKPQMIPCMHALNRYETIKRAWHGMIKIKVNIDNVELLNEPDIPEKLPNCQDLQEKLNDLQSSVRKQIQKSVRIESSLRILGESVPYESNLQND